MDNPFPLILKTVRSIYMWGRGGSPLILGTKDYQTSADERALLTESNSLRTARILRAGSNCTND